MKKTTLGWTLLAFLLVLAAPAHADDSPMGLWKTIDDDGKTEKSYVQITEKDGTLSGKVIRLLQKPQDTLCDQCTGDKKDQPIVGMEIMWGLKKEENGNAYSGGKIMDPDNGKEYRCKIWREGDMLKVRGYIAFLYRTQTWFLVKEPQ
jgi:uncharacterized protein (DUF2147 family)